MEVNTTPQHLSDSIEHIHEDYEPSSPSDLEKQHHPKGAAGTTTIAPLSLIRTLSARSTRSFDPGPPPNSGKLAWTQVACAHFIVASCWGFVTSFGAFQTYYVTDLHLEPSNVSWIGSVQTTLLFLVGVAAGRAMDAGWFKWLICGGALMQVVGVMALSVSRQYWALLVTQGVVFGLGAGLVFTPTMACVSTYFSTRRNIAIGIVASGSVTGGLIFPGIVRSTLVPLGFPWTMRILAFIMLTFNIPAILLMRTRVPPRPSGPLVEWSAFKEAPYTLFIAGMFFAFWSLYFAFYYVGSFGRGVIGLDYASSIDLLMVMVGVGLPGRLIPNYIADRFSGPLQAMTPPVFICGILFFGWTGVKSSTGLYVFAAVYGTASGAVQSLWPATLSSLTTDLKKAGTRLGMGFTIVSVATLTGPPLAGALVSLNGGDYLFAQVWAGCCMLLGGSLLIASRTAKVGWVLRAKL